MTTATNAAMQTRDIPHRVHVVGAGGRHMSAVAQILHTWGHEVTGSDQKANSWTEKLGSLGIPVTIGHAAENIGAAELVTYTSAARAENPELVEARKRGLPVLKRDEMVARLMRGRFGVAVAGTHGKTTTSGLMTHILIEAGLDPMYLIGGEVRGLGSNAGVGAGTHVVVEADEYDKAFLAYTPDVAIVLNVESDHMDVFTDEEDLHESFRQFMANVPEDGHLVACADSPGVREVMGRGGIGVRDVQMYGVEAGTPRPKWSARNITNEGATQTFEAVRGEAGVGTYTITLAGRHNVANCLAGVAASVAMGIDDDVIKRALSTYRGTGRRFELVGEARGVTVMDDYAHHPTEARATIAAAKERFAGRRLVVLFQPYSFSRTRYLLDEWKTCFAGVDKLYVFQTFAGREGPEAGISGSQLVEILGPQVMYIDTFEQAAERIPGELRAGDVFFTFGSGPEIDKAGRLVLERLRGG